MPPELPGGLSQGFDVDFDFNCACTNDKNGDDDGLDDENHRELVKQFWSCFLGARQFNSESRFLVSVSAKHLECFKNALLLHGHRHSRYSYNHVTEIVELELTQSFTHYYVLHGLEALIDKTKKNLVRRLERAVRDSDTDTGNNNNNNYYNNNNNNYNNYNNNYNNKYNLLTAPTSLFGSWPKTNTAPVAVDHASIRKAISRLNEVVVWSGVHVYGPGLSGNQPDVSFCERTEQTPRYWIPSVVGEIAYSETTADVERKAQNFITQNVQPDGTRIRLVFIIDIAYPAADSATLSVLAPRKTTAEPESVWILRGCEFYRQGAAQQRQGGLDIFVSDFLANNNDLPAQLSRHHTFSELGQVTMTFEELRNMMRKALDLVELTNARKKRKD